MKYLSHRQNLFSSSKNKLLMTAACFMVAILILVIIIVLTNRSSSSTPPPKQTAQATDIKDEELSSNGIEISNEIKAIEKSSRDNNLKNGTNVKVVIKATNRAEQQSRFITLKTSLKPTYFYDMRNYQGTTGISREDDKITIKNVILQPNQSQEISFEATLNVPNATELSFVTDLIDISGQTVTKSKPINYKVVEN